MDFFFVRDYRHRPRFFSAGPLGPLPADFSKTREVWEKAKKQGHQPQSPDPPPGTGL